MTEPQTAAERVALNRQLAQMLKGGVIMDVTTPEQAHIAEEAGACAVMALERIPADIRAAGGVSRMSDPKMIKGIQKAVSIPVMAKCRIGHFVEAQVLQAIDIDYIDESEVLSPADDTFHIDKTQFNVPFSCTYFTRSTGTCSCLAASKSSSSRRFWMRRISEFIMRMWRTA